jgi:hypothetical protein
MSAQPSFLEADATGAYPGLMLVLVMILTVLGVIAHVAFA